MHLPRRRAERRRAEPVADGRRARRPSRSSPSTSRSRHSPIRRLERGLGVVRERGRASCRRRRSSARRRARTGRGTPRAGRPRRGLGVRPRGQCRSSHSTTVAHAREPGSRCSKWPSASSSTSSHRRAAAANPRLIADGHDVVAAAVDEQRRDTERQPARGRGLAVAVGHAGGRAAQQPLDHAAADARPRPRGRGRRRPPGRRRADSGTRASLAPRRPQRQVAAGRVADRGDAPEVERRVELGEVVDRRGHVVERRRPAAARAKADAAVLDVPGRPSARRRGRRASASIRWRS